MSGYALGPVYGLGLELACFTLIAASDQAVRVRPIFSFVIQRPRSLQTFIHSLKIIVTSYRNCQ
jgi:hypothetical protein